MQSIAPFSPTSKSASQILSLKPSSFVSKESDLQTSSLKLWPIPAQQEINLLLPDSIIKPIYWQLTDLQGKQINSGYANPLINNTIDLVSLNNGIYLLTFNLPEKSLTRIIEIQK